MIEPPLSSPVDVGIPTGVSPLVPIAALGAAGARAFQKQRQVDLEASRAAAEEKSGISSFSRARAAARGRSIVKRVPKPPRVEPPLERPPLIRGVGLPDVALPILIGQQFQRILHVPVVTTTGPT